MRTASTPAAAVDTWVNSADFSIPAGGADNAPTDGSLFCPDLIAGSGEATAMGVTWFLGGATFYKTTIPPLGPGYANYAPVSPQSWTDITGHYSVTFSSADCQCLFAKAPNGTFYGGVRWVHFLDFKATPITGGGSSECDTQIIYDPSVSCPSGGGGGGALSDPNATANSTPSDGTTDTGSSDTSSPTVIWFDCTDYTWADGSEILSCTRV